MVINISSEQIHFSSGWYAKYLGDSKLCLGIISPKATLLTKKTT